MLQPDVFEATSSAISSSWSTLQSGKPADWNPIKTYDAMAAGMISSICRSPSATPTIRGAGAAKPMTFANDRRPRARIRAPGAILGGAGCAISAHCTRCRGGRHLPGLSLHQPAHQAGDYVAHGGQPGLRTAWTDPDGQRGLAAISSPIRWRRSTRRSLRPRFDGFIPAYEHMALRVHHWLKEGGERPPSSPMPTTPMPAPARRPRGRTSRGTTDMAKALQDVTVLDFSHLLQGPFATQLLGDMGARHHQGGASRAGRPVPHDDVQEPVGRRDRKPELPRLEPQQAVARDRSEGAGGEGEPLQDRRAGRCRAAELPSRRHGAARLRL